MTPGRRDQVILAGIMLTAVALRFADLPSRGEWATAAPQPTAAQAPVPPRTAPDAPAPTAEPPSWPKFTLPPWLTTLFVPPTPRS